MDDTELPIDDSEEVAAKPSGSLDDWWKKFGKLVVESYEPLKFRQKVVTGILPFDITSGVGGLPFGCIVTLYGKEGSGKTTFWQTVAGAVQREYPERIIVIVDAEASLDVPTLRRNGMQWTNELLNAHKIIYLVPTLENGLSYEKCIVMLEGLLSAAPQGVFMVIDSLDALSTQSELQLDADDGGAKYGGMAKSNSVMLKRFLGELRRTNSNLFVVQQLREKIGGMSPVKQYGTSGGHAILHDSHIRMRFTPIQQIPDKKTGEILGHQVEVKIEKNKFFRPHLKCTMDLRYDFGDKFPGGFDRAGAVVDYGLEYGLLEKKGNTISFTTVADARAVGRDAARRWLTDNPDKAAELSALILEKAMNGTQ